MLLFLLQRLEVGGGTCSAADLRMNTELRRIIQGELDSVRGPSDGATDGAGASNSSSEAHSDMDLDSEESHGRMEIESVRTHVYFGLRERG